jgi:type VI secretion system secreted protein Hcp
MAVDMFLKLGDIKGESEDSSHQGEIEVLAWSWGMTQSGTMHSGAGGGAGRVNVQDLSVTKYVDKSSPNIMLKCCTGKHYPDALLTVRKAGDTPIEYIKITMTDVLITSVSTGGSGGEDQVTENVTLNFAKFKHEYTIQSADGTAGATLPTTFNIRQNVAE